MATNKSTEPKTIVIMTQSLCGPKTAVHRGEEHECSESEAARLIDAGFAKAKPETAAA